MRALAFLQDFGQRPSLDVILRVIRTLFSFISSSSFPYPATLSKTQYLNSLSLIQLGLDELATEHFYKRLPGQSWGADSTSWDRRWGRAGGCDILQQHWIQKSFCVHSLWTTFRCHPITSPNSFLSLSARLPPQLLGSKSHYSIFEGVLTLWWMFNILAFNFSKLSVPAVWRQDL